MVLDALLLQHQVLHEHDSVHIEGHFDLFGYFYDRAIGNVILNYLHDASLPKERGGVLYDHDLGFETQDSEQSYFLIEFAVDSALHAFDY